MKKEYIIGGCIGILFVVAIVICMVVSKKVENKEPYIPTIAKIQSLDENGNVIEDENKIKLEGEDKKKIEEYTEQIKDSMQKQTFSMIILADYNIRIDEHISMKIQSNIKEYVCYVDDTKEDAKKEIVTRAPDGFVDWVISRATK